MSSFGLMSVRDVPDHLRKVPGPWLDDGPMSHTKRSYVSTGVARMVRVRKTLGWVSAHRPCQQNRDVLSALDVPCQQKTSGSWNGPGGCNRKSGVVATARNAVQRKQDEREAMDTLV
jgi:hypothetical protein